MYVHSTNVHFTLSRNAVLWECYHRMSKALSLVPRPYFYIKVWGKIRIHPLTLISGDEARCLCHFCELWYPFVLFLYYFCIIFVALFGLVHF